MNDPPPSIQFVFLTISSTLLYLVSISISSYHLTRSFGIFIPSQYAPITGSSLFIQLTIDRYC